MNDGDVSYFFLLEVVMLLHSAAMVAKKLLA